MGIFEIIALAVIIGLPVSIAAAGIVYVRRLARLGPEATLRAAVRHREVT